MAEFKVGDRVILDTQDWHYPGKRTHTEYRVTVVSVNTPRDGYGFGYHVMFEGERATYGANGHQLSPLSEHDIPCYIVKGKPSGVDDETGEKFLQAGDPVTIFTATAGTGGIQEAVDNVNHPPHYKKYPVEVIEITEQLDFNRGNAVKYILRAGHKVGVDEAEDLSKAAWYIARALEKLKKERANGEG